MFGTLGIQEILIVLVIGIVVFGVIRMPKILSFLGAGVKKYRRIRNTLKNPLNFDKFLDELHQKGQQGQWQGDPSQDQSPPGRPEQSGEQKPPDRGGDNT